MSTEKTSTQATIRPGPLPRPITPHQTRLPIADTPRTRKQPASDQLHGIKTLKVTPDALREKVAKRLNVPFELEDWQGQLIHKVKAGYDAFFLAGTGYGKSVVFEGLAALDKNKMVIIISPLKALERDQVRTVTVRPRGTE